MSRYVRAESSEVKLLLQEWKRLEFRNSVLYRRCVDHGNQVYQLVLPQQFRDCALKCIHDDVGYLGAERALSLAHARFY